MFSLVQDVPKVYKKLNISLCSFSLSLFPHQLYLGCSPWIITWTLLKYRYGQRRPRSVDQWRKSPHQSTRKGAFSTRYLTYTPQHLKYSSCGIGKNKKPSVPPSLPGRPLRPRRDPGHQAGEGRPGGHGSQRGSSRDNGTAISLERTQESHARGELRGV